MESAVPEATEALPMSDVILTADALAHALALGSDVTLCASLADTLATDLRTDNTPPRLEDDYPALDRWRRHVLEHGGHPLELAAAWELTALTCARDGLTYLADECIANAQRALGVDA